MLAAVLRRYVLIVLRKHSFVIYSVQKKKLSNPTNDNNIIYL